MVFGFGKIRPLSPEKEVAIIEYLARQIPGETIAPEFRETALKLRGGTQDDFLRRFYLDLEARLLARRIPEWSNIATIREKLGDRFGIAHVFPSGFTMLFAPRSAQYMALLKLFLEGFWQHVGWDSVTRVRILHEAAAGTPLETMLDISEAAWAEAFSGFLQLPVKEREIVILGAFQRSIERSFGDFLKEQGGGRAKIAAEAVARTLQKEFATVDAISGLLPVLPKGVLQEERLTFAPRAELAQAVTRQTQEMRGKNIALVYEAERLQETIFELQKAKEQAEAMASAQQDFITVVSHQFRTPLAAIRWQTEALLDIASQKPELAQVVEAANIVRERVAFLVGVLENIFDLLVIDSGRFQVHIDRHPLPVLLQGVCMEMEEEAGRRKMTITCEAGELPAYAFDLQAISRVLRILGTNALQYSEEGDTVTFRAVHTIHPERGAEILVSVGDHGIGIRSEDRPKIFEKFFRGHNAVMKVPDGAGIALYIAKRIVEFHGGKMWVESKGTGLGSTFSFTIPEQTGTQDSGGAQ